MPWTQLKEALCLHSLNWQPSSSPTPHLHPFTNNCNVDAHSSDNKRRIHDGVKDDALIVGAINAMWPEVCSLKVKASSLFAVTTEEPCLLCALLECHVPEPGADGMKETLNCGEKPKASTWGLAGWHHGGTNSMFTPPGSSSANTTRGFLSLQIMAFTGLLSLPQIFRKYGIWWTCKD